MKARKVNQLQKIRNLLNTKFPHFYVKNGNFGQKSNFWSKIEILVNNRNFGHKSKFFSKIKIFVKNRNFGQTSKFWSKIKNFREINVLNNLKFRKSL